MKARRSDKQRQQVFAYFNHRAFQREAALVNAKAAKEGTSFIGKMIAKFFKRTTNK